MLSADTAPVEGSSSRPLRGVGSLCTLPSWDVLALASVVLLSLGSAWNSGEYSSFGITCVLIAGVLAIAAAVRRQFVGVGASPCVIWPVATVVLALLNLAPGVVPANRQTATALAVTLAAAGTGLCFVERQSVRWLLLCVASGVDVALAWIHLRWGRAAIDVFGHIQGASLQLLHGHDPYAATYASTTPGTQSFHFPYFPGLLLISAPARLIGDIRVGDAIALLVLFVCIAVLSRRRGSSRRADAAVAIAVTSPFGPFMVVQAWPEIYAVAAVALWLVLRERWPRYGVAALALGFAVVPTAGPLLVGYWLWWPRARVQATLAAGLAVLLSLPFALWAGLGNFVADTVEFQLRLPVRADALSVNGLLAHLDLAYLPWWVGFVVGAVGILFVRRARVRYWDSGMLLASTMTLVLFVMAKWAFFNYYFIVAFGLVLSLALASFSDEPLCLSPHVVRLPSALAGATGPAVPSR